MTGVWGSVVLLQMETSHPVEIIEDIQPSHGFVCVASNEKGTQSCDFPYPVKQYRIFSGLVCKFVKILMTQNKEIMIRLTQVGKLYQPASLKPFSVPLIGSSPTVKSG